MDESELDRIRSARLSEMKGSSGMQSGPSLQGGTDHSKEAEQQAQQEQQRSNMLFQILNNDARTRLSRIAILKESKARAVEDLLLNMAKSGQLREKVGEKQLIELLETISAQTTSGPTIKFNRRKSESDDDEDEWNI